MRSWKSEVDMKIYSSYPSKVVFSNSTTEKNRKGTHPDFCFLTCLIFFIINKMPEILNFCQGDWFLAFFVECKNNWGELKVMFYSLWGFSFLSEEKRFSLNLVLNLVWSCQKHACMTFSIYLFQWVRICFRFRHAPSRFAFQLVLIIF